MNERILLVEDDENLGITLLERLKTEGYQATLARSAEEALQATETLPFDLMIFDVGLPDRSGFEIAKDLRKKNNHCAIIFLTALGDPEHRIQGLELGAEDYIVKPFHLKELLLRIQNGLKRSKYLSESEDRVRVGKAIIYFNKLEAHVPSGVVELTQKEAALIKFLYQRKGSVVSRDEILNFIWSDQQYPTPRTIDNFIMKIRRLVEFDPENPAIVKSIRGVGYRLIDERDSSI
jgi:two-component system alkaline phosphatase synthesis response regulator PhoP